MSWSIDDKKAKIIKQFDDESKKSAKVCNESPRIIRVEVPKDNVQGQLFFNIYKPNQNRPLPATLVNKTEKPPLASFNL